MMARGGGKNSSAFYTTLAFINLPSWPMRLDGQKNYINNRRFCIPHYVPLKMKEIVPFWVNATVVWKQLKKIGPFLLLRTLCDVLTLIAKQAINKNWLHRIAVIDN